MSLLPPRYSDVSEAESDPTLMELVGKPSADIEDASSTAIGQMAASISETEADRKTSQKSVVKSGKFFSYLYIFFVCFLRCRMLIKAKLM